MGGALLGGQSSTGWAELYWVGGAVLGGWSSTGWAELYCVGEALLGGWSSTGWKSREKEQSSMIVTFELLPCTTHTYS